MALETPRERLIALLAAAIVLLLGRAAALIYGAPPPVAQGLYFAALACLVGCVLVVATERV